MVQAMEPQRGSEQRSVRSRAGSSQGSVPEEAAKDVQTGSFCFEPSEAFKETCSGSSLGSVPKEGSEGTPGPALSWAPCPRKANDRKKERVWATAKDKQYKQQQAALQQR